MSVSRLALGRLPTACLPCLPRAPALPSLRCLSLATACRADTPTHTGQQWQDNDLRSVRFAVTGTEKQVNDQWAIDLIAATPVKTVATRIVSCDGGGGAKGHPRVYINLDHGNPESCIYCGLRFQLEQHH